MDNIIIKQVDELKLIEKIIINFDKCFKPSLSERIENLYLYSQKLYNNAITIQAVLKEKTVGFASFYCNDKENYVAYLTQIGILENTRGHKVGSKLLEEVIKICIKNNMKYLKLEVFNHNEIAINFYKKNGFQEVEEASDTSIYMIKKLEEI